MALLDRFRRARPRRRPDDGPTTVRPSDATDQNHLLDFITSHRGVEGSDAIDPGLDALSLDETVAFTRGFMLFSMLANLAEDRQGIAAEPGTSLADVVAWLEEEGVAKDEILALLDHAAGQETPRNVFQFGGRQR